MPTVSNPPPYSWLGADDLRTELPSGVIGMGARSYVPQLGRLLQPDPVPGGSANAYSYTFGDPVNSFDTTGMYVEGAYLYAFNAEENQRSIEREAAREAAARAAAELAAREVEEAAAAAAGPQYEEPGPLGGSAGWACEYAAETGQEAPGCGGGGGINPALILGAATGGPNHEHHPGSANEGGTGPCRSGGKQVHGKCQPRTGGGESSCEAFVVVTGSPGMWEPGGWVYIGFGTAYCVAHG